MVAFVYHSVCSVYANVLSVLRPRSDDCCVARGCCAEWMCGQRLDIM